MFPLTIILKPTLTAFYFLSTDLWDVVKNEMVWPTPEDKLLYQNYLVPDFLESSKDVPQKKCILVQCRQKYEETGLYEFRFFPTSIG